MGADLNVDPRVYWLSLDSAKGEVLIHRDHLIGVGGISKPAKDIPPSRQLYLTSGFTAYCLDTDANREKLGLSLDRSQDEAIIAAAPEKKKAWVDRKTYFARKNANTASTDAPKRGRGRPKSAPVE